MQSRAKYFAGWRRKNRLAKWLHLRDTLARKLERTGGRVMILGVRVRWKVAYD